MKLACWSLASLLAAACNLDNPGVEPPRGELAYPIALELSREVVAEGEDPEQEGAPRFLYVANSNFDLRYNAGSVQAYDLTKLYQQLTDPNWTPESDKGSCLDDLSQDGEGLSVLDAGPDAGAAADAGLPEDAGFAMDAALVPDAALEGGVADAMAAGADAALDGSLPLADGGLDAALDAASAADAASATDAGDMSDAGADAGELADGAVPEPMPLEPSPVAGGVHGPSYYGTLRGLLCDGRDRPGLEACCYSRESLADEKNGLLLSEVLTGSYASGIALSPNGKRMYVPLRSGGRLLYLDIDVKSSGAASASVELGCGGDEDDCERGPDADTDDQVPDGQLAPYPTALVAASLRELGQDRDETFIAMTHERGQVSLFVERDGAPVLEDVFAYPAQLLNSITLSPPGLFGEERPRLLHVTSASTQDIGRLGVRLESSEAPGESGQRELLYRTSSIVLNNLSFPVDLRSVVFDPTNPRRLFALVRGVQQSVAFIEFDSAFEDEASVVEAIRIGAGPSKMKIITLGSRQLLLVSAYDARTIDIIDTHSRELVAQVRGLSGPFDMVMDETRKLLYVADFRGSVVRVVDMRGLVDPNKPPPRIVATLGSLYFAEGPN